MALINLDFMWRVASLNAALLIFDEQQTVLSGAKV